MSEFLVYGAFSSMAFTLVLGILAARGGSYLCRLSQTILLFRRRWTERAFAAVMGIMVTFGGAFMIGSLMQASQHQADASGFLLLVVFIVGGIALLWRTGPEEIRLDMQEREYRLVTGPPLFSKTQSGSWDAFQGVSVWAAGRGGYVVSLAWADGRRRGPMLGRFRFRSDADRFAQEVGGILALPCVRLSPNGF